MTTDALTDAELGEWLLGLLTEGQWTPTTIARIEEASRRLSRAAPATPPRDAVAMIAERLFEKFGVQCGMGELAMWRPIARAALDAAPAQPTQWKDTDAICPTCGTDTSLTRKAEPGEG